jgi:hypothetical protein
MSSPVLSSVERQIRRVARRLSLQRFLDLLIWCWTGALALTAVWFFLQPYLVDEAPDWLRWAVGGGVLGLATILAAALTYLRTPSPLTTALALDEKFALQERVTTFLALTSSDAATSAGQALAADVNQKVSGLDVRSRFPVRLSRSAIAVPLAAILLVLIVLFHNPSPSEATTTPRNPSELKKDLDRPVANADEIKQKLVNLKKKLGNEQPKEAKSKKLEEIELDLDKLVKKMPQDGDRDKIREIAEEIRPIEEKIEKRINELKEEKEKKEKLKRQLAELPQRDEQGKAKPPDEGPAKNLEDALGKGDLGKAQKELEKLGEQLKKDRIGEKDKKQLDQQMEKLKERLDKLADQKEKKEQLKKDKEQANEEQKQKIEQEEKKLQQETKELKDLAEQLGQCKECMKQGDNKKAGEKLEQAAKQLQKMEQQGKELQDLQGKLNDLKQAQDCIGQGLQEGQKKSPRPGGERTAAKEGPTQWKDAKQQGELDVKGQMKIVGVGEGGSFKKISSGKVEEAFHQAVQDAPEAMEHLRVPPDAADFTKGYFGKLGGQKK